jgi:hypothetical protein
MIAVERRFGRQASPAALVEFVSQVRVQSDSLADKIDPRIAERLLSAVYTNDRLSDLDARTVWQTHLLLLAGLVASARLDDSALDGLLAEARKLADQLTA